jgi:hypothetical protein
VILDSYPATLSRAAGTTLELTAIPSSGYVFVEWGGDVNGNNESTTLLLNCDTTVTAIFSRVRSTFAWWWLVAGIGAISITLLVYLRLIRKGFTPENFPT